MTPGNRERGFAEILLPARRLRTISISAAMNPVERSHRTTHNMGDASDLGASDLVAHSRIINGSTHRMKLITGAHLELEIIVFIVAASVINSTCSLKIPMPVSAKVHRIKRSHVPSARRSL
jgi:hypothetical protein